MLEDKVFGTIFYDITGWGKALKIQFGNKEQEIWLHVEGEEDGIGITLSKECVVEVGYHEIIC